ncbi:MAG: insulinase family protein [Dysgonamonadaceae bacterium]|jgi:predicted Zn-dependent peptidase|nr:insulinase family protein [Dysgonamonadaceae bacterium]
MQNYETYTFPSGLRLIHYPVNTPISYCGFAVNVGTRDEKPEHFGIAHFTEHMLFKGTSKRKSGHIINRMENVGGELNAYTTKEETIIYSIFLEEHFERAFELLTDLVFNSQFPESEIEKERDVILDEINSYKDNPSELIFDEFEDLLFEKHEIGHNILGEPETLENIDKKAFLDFHTSFYRPCNMVFFSMGRIPFKQILRIANKYLNTLNYPASVELKRISPEKSSGQHKKTDKDLFQNHVIIGSRAYNLFDKNRVSLFLLNNILGGPGMNSRLNLSLREKSGLVYNVESNVTSYTDTGIFSIYFGCDPKFTEKCISLTYKELRKLKEISLTDAQLSTAKKQLKGQLGISNENKENISLSMGKSFLHRNRYDSLEKIYEKIDGISSNHLLEVANEIFDEKELSMLIY